MKRDRWPWQARVPGVHIIGDVQLPEGFDPPTASVGGPPLQETPDTHEDLAMVARHQAVRQLIALHSLQFADLLDAARREVGLE